MRTRLRRPLRVTVGIVAVLVVGAGVSEAVARQALTERVTTALAGNLGSDRRCHSAHVRCCSRPSTTHSPR